MTTTAATPDTFTIERDYKASAAKLFEALSNPAKKRRWYAEGSYGHDVEKFEMDFRVGGAEIAEYRFRQGTPFPGAAFVNHGVFIDIAAGERIVEASRMAIAGRPISAAMVTFEVLGGAHGSTLRLTHQAMFFEGSDGPEMRKQGWQKLLDRLMAFLNDE